MADNRWYNYTNKVRFDPGGENMFRTRPRRPLPPLYNGATASFCNGERRFLIAFGGLKPDDTPSADFVGIDLGGEEPTWWKLNITGGSIAPRDSPSMRIVDNKLFIFGGFLGDDSELTHTHTFSVAEYQEPGGWSWIIRDQPYPRHVKSSPWVRLNTHPAFDGTKIILVAGEEQANHHIGTDGSKLILFDVHEHTFEPIYDAKGDFPHTEISFDVGTFSTRHSPEQSESIIIAGFATAGRNTVTRRCGDSSWMNEDATDFPSATCCGN